MKLNKLEIEKLRTCLKEERKNVNYFILMIITGTLLDIYLKVMGLTGHLFKKTIFDLFEVVLLIILIMYYKKYRPTLKKCFTKNYIVINCLYCFNYHYTEQDKYCLYFVNTDTEDNKRHFDFKLYCDEKGYSEDLYYRIYDEELYGKLEKDSIKRLIIYKDERLMIDTASNKPIKLAYCFY